SVSPAFLLLGEGAAADALLSTGVAAWDVKPLGGYAFVPPRATGFTGVGARTNVNGNAFDWGFETGVGDGWRAAVEVGRPRVKALMWEQESRFLRPAVLPAMTEARRTVGVARHVMPLPAIDPVEGKPNGPPVRAADNLPAEQRQWSAMLAGKGTVTVPPHTTRRAIVDLGDYYCAYEDLQVSGGRGAIVRTLWAEALYRRVPKASGASGETTLDKGNRDEVDGRFFLGMGSTFMLDGGPSRVYGPLWWDAGRYVAIDVRTADEPVTIESFTLRETGYPFEFTAAFDASDPRLAEVTPIALRTLQTCAHETYMDCPYYEQLMYVGDTRLEVLTTYATTADERLPRKAVELFDLSRDTEGFTSSRYPTWVAQRIPTFSMWWVGMVHDYAHWRSDPAFVAARMPGVRAVCEAVRAHTDAATGLVRTPPGWNFVDWVNGWAGGVPPVGYHGVKGTVNWQAALMFRHAADLEALAGEPELAARNAAAAQRLVRAIDGAFYDVGRGLYAEDLDHKHYSEHAQCLALIDGAIDADPARRAMLAEGLLGAPDLYRTTIYFSHYLFEAYRLLGRADRIFDRMGLWFGLKANGFRTTPEQPEPARSDCHAWGAHPVFHYFATILGVRPASAGFGTVRVHPQLGPLTWARGEMPHPAGVIRADLKREGETLRGSVELPAGVSGELVLPQGTRPLVAGANEV
ncbi:MAG TPA: alpha-L-rhamnosidase C-terminal domain-containing protein, partial [Tepidisphaeraceae bacterium]|nr:alpha-L-rhamnosidase C-terminal domain-containing protein [Tepidisphaeraceae bacterium]